MPLILPRALLSRRHHHKMRGSGFYMLDSKSNRFTTLFGLRFLMRDTCDNDIHVFMISFCRFLKQPAISNYAAASMIIVNLIVLKYRSLMLGQRSCRNMQG